MLSCTGPGAASRLPASAASGGCRAAAISSRCSASVPVPSGGSTSTSARTKVLNIPGWRVVWLAPVPRSSGGRSALSTTTGTPAWEASITAGSSSPTAVPLVVSTPHGWPVERATPRAVNAASRSSIRTCTLSAPLAWAAAAA